MNINANALKCAAVLALLPALSPLALAQTDWQGSLGDWFIASNWTQGVPASNSDASIANGGTALVSSGSPHAQASILRIGNGGNGTVLLSGNGRLDFNTVCYLGETFG